MRLAKPIRRSGSSGFTLIEVLITLLILSVIMGAVFDQIRVASIRSTSEQQKLDMFQEAREFVDQMGRDIRNAGFPNQHNFNATAAATAVTNAQGIMYVGPGDIWFQGDVDGTGTVSFVKYHLDTTNNANCPCLRRSVTSKASWLSGAGDNYTVEVQGVQNPNTTSWVTANPIFTYYYVDGTPLDLSGYAGNVIDGTAAATPTADLQKLAQIDRVKVQLSVESKYADLQTGLTPIITLNSTVMIYNCNQLAAGQAYSWACQ